MFQLLLVSSVIQLIFFLSGVCVVDCENVASGVLGQGAVQRHAVSWRELRVSSIYHRHFDHRISHSFIITLLLSRFIIVTVVICCSLLQ